MEKFSYKKMKETGEIPPEIMDKIRAFSEGYNNWLKSENRRFESVKNATEGYLKTQGKLIPPEYSDWFDFCAETGRDLRELITDKDFLTYHKWRVRVMNEPEPRKEKSWSDRAGGICLALAYNEDRLPESLYRPGGNRDIEWTSKRTKNFVNGQFSLTDSHRTCRYAYELFNDLERAEERWPDDYKLGKMLFLTNFSEED